MAVADDLEQMQSLLPPGSWKQIAYSSLEQVVAAVLADLEGVVVAATDGA